jgi:hypothetical protein
MLKLLGLYVRLMRGLTVRNSVICLQDICTGFSVSQNKTRLFT